jgi:hypothetical protein
MAGAIAVVQPSRMESFSIVTLEAFSVGTPVIANAQSRVLADHCRKANAGLYYGDFEEFEEISTLLLNDRNLARSLGRNGQTYVKDNYGWNRLLPKYELVFRSSARPAREPRGARGRAPDASATGAPHEPEHEDLVSTGDLPLLEPEPDEEPLEAHAEELETAEGTEEFDELVPEETEYAKEEAEPEMTREGRDAPEEEPYYEPTPEPEPAPAEEFREARPEESPPADDSELPAFYRPRQRPVSSQKGAPEPAKED